MMQNSRDSYADSLNITRQFPVVIECLCRVFCGYLICPVLVCINNTNKDNVIHRRVDPCVMLSKIPDSYYCNLRCLVHSKIPFKPVIPNHSTCHPEPSYLSSRTIVPVIPNLFRDLLT